MNFFQALLTCTTPPPLPTLYDMMLFDGLLSRGNVSARQLALEPSVTGVDSAMSWSCWMQQSNVYATSQRIFGVAETAANVRQYDFGIQGRDGLNPALNNRGQFALFTDNSNFLLVTTTNKIPCGRATHIGITYDGSETAGGFKIYINGVEDTTATKSMTGTYTGARNSANFRYCVSRVDSATNRYAGDVRDLCVWNRVLTSGEIVNLYNDGDPIDVNTLAFYAAAIAAYWPMRTTTNCLNSATFNLSNTSITTRTVPIKADYIPLSIFNAVVGNTNYLFSAGMFENKAVLASATSHVGTRHVMQRMICNGLGLSTGTPYDILNNASIDYRGGPSVIIDGTNVKMVGQEYSFPGLTFIAHGDWTSTDGVVGDAFGSINSLAMVDPTSTAAQFYGTPIRGYGAGEYIFPHYEFKTGGTWRIDYWKYTIGSGWTRHDVWVGTGTDAYTEWCIAAVGNNTYIGMTRSNVKGGLWYTVSTDGGATWSVPVDSGLGTGECMANMAVDPEGNIFIAFGDRGSPLSAGSGSIKISTRNVPADILADPTDWNTETIVFRAYATDSLGILGYPVPIIDGFNAYILFCTEFSVSRADAYLGYGQIVYGV